MPEQVQYRILERQTTEGWTPFAVAYRRRDRFVLFHPVWRAHRTLPVKSLNELSDQHFPSTDALYRWSPVQTCAETVTHPIELLQRAFTVQPATAPQQSETAAGVVEAIRTLLGGAPPFAFARGGTREGVPAEEEELPDPDTMARDLQALFEDDPDLLAAFVNLRAALADPQMRPTVLAALEAFARAAHSTEE